MWLECSIGNDILAVFLTFVVLLKLKMVLIMRKDVGRNDKHFEENVSHFSDNREKRKEFTTARQITNRQKICRNRIWVIM